MFLRRPYQPAFDILEDRRVLTVSFQFDYSLDTNNFFDTQAKKDLLTLAGQMLTSHFADTLSAITPSGSNTWNASVPHPGTGATQSLGNISIAADVILIFAGGRNLTAPQVGLGGGGGFSASGSQAWFDTIQGRGEPGALGSASQQTDFAPSHGFITFDTVGVTWFFGTTTAGLANGQTDFLSIALHELGHVLGIGTANSWDRLVSGSNFTGAESVASFGSNVPLSGDLSHWADGTMSGGQETAMDPVITQGTRKTFTPLDFAGMDDIGWEVVDPVGITVTPTSGLQTTEAGGTATFTVVLNSIPSANVTIGLSSSDTTEGTLSTASLVFTPQNALTKQTVTVTGVNDILDDGDISYSIITAAAVSSDTSYNGLNPSNVSLLNLDDDAPPGVTVTPTSGLQTTEAGGTATFTVVLNSTPAANVFITLNSSDTSEGTISTSVLTFTSQNAMTPQTVTVTGVDDIADDGDVGYSIITSATSADGNYNSIGVSDVSLTNLDDDLPPGITVTPTSGLQTTEAGGTATFTVVLNSTPGSSVVISLSSSDLTEGTVSPALLTFTPQDALTAQTVTVTGVDDLLGDGNISYGIISDPAVSLDGNYNGINPADVSVTNIDNDIITWANRDGQSNFNDQGTATALDLAGNTYVTGLIGNGTRSDIFLAKYDPDGVLVWQKQIGGTSNDSGLAVAVDVTGNVYVTGSFTGTVDFDPNPAVTSNLTSTKLKTAFTADIFVLKLTTAGDFVWAKRIGGTGIDVGRGITVDATGDVHLTGSFAGSVDFNPDPVLANKLASARNAVGAFTPDIFLEKLTTDGNFVWAKRMGGNGTDFGQGVAVDNAGSVYVTGYFSTSALFTSLKLVSRGSTDAFVTRYATADGAFGWAKRLGGKGADQGTAIAVSGSAVVTTGFFAGTGFFDPNVTNGNPLTSAGSSDVFLSQLTTAGAFTLARRLGSTGADQGRGLSIASDGDILLTGSFTGNVDFDPGAGTTTLFGAGGTDAFVVRLDSAANLLAARRSGGTGNDVSAAIVAGTQDYLFIARTFTGSMSVNTGPTVVSLTSAGLTDLFVARLVV